MTREYDSQRRQLEQSLRELSTRVETNRVAGGERDKERLEEDRQTEGIGADAVNFLYEYLKEMNPMIVQYFNIVDKKISSLEIFPGLSVSRGREREVKVTDRWGHESFLSVG